MWGSLSLLSSPHLHRVEEAKTKVVSSTRGGMEDVLIEQEDIPIVEQAIDVSIGA
jgi:hypothetical protein